jgi:hypothetical protein
MSDMKLRASLCVFAALLIWANVSHACDSAHEANLSLNLVQEEMQEIIAAQAAASSMAIEAELAADADRIADYDAVPTETWTRQADIGAYVLTVEAELTADISTLLLDHEGESFAFLTASEMAATAQASDEYAVGEPVNLSLVEADATRFPVDDEDVATFSQANEERSEPEATGSTVMHLNETEIVLDGHEDR